MSIASPSLAPGASAAAIPQDYNFAADVLKRNLDAGRAEAGLHRPAQILTYGKLARRVDCFGRVLRARGIRREDRILLCLLDTVDWPTAFLGAIKFGAVPVPVNTLMTDDDYRFMLTDSRARMLIVSEALLPKFKNLIGTCPDLEHVIVSGDSGHGYRRLKDLIKAAMQGASSRRSGQELTDARRPVYTAATKRDEMCFWLYTSGSTGKPKAAVHTHADLRFTDDLYAGPILGITADDMCYSVAKLFFAYGLGNALTFPMSAGATTILCRTGPRRTWSLIF